MQNNNAPRNIDQLVVNWHLTQACNYRCRYCYSSWEKKCRSKEVFRERSITAQMLKELFQFFRPNNSENPIYSSLRWRNVRLSLAGGETLLHAEKTTQIAQEAKKLGFEISLITNGSLLDLKKTPNLAKSISMLGISLDSAIPEINRQIGRSDISGQTLDLERLSRTIDFARKLNPDLIVKINTVVNELNLAEDLTRTIEQLRPEKWKILKALPVITTDLSISEEHFEAFVNRHRHLGGILSVESNQDMTESYIMVDPIGRFFQNQLIPDAAAPYIYSQAIIDIGAEEAFKQIHFNADKFAARYSTLAMGATQ